MNDEEFAMVFELMLASTQMLQRADLVSFLRRIDDDSEELWRMFEERVIEIDRETFDRNVEITLRIVRLAKDARRLLRSFERLSCKAPASTVHASRTLDLLECSDSSQPQL